MQEQTREREIDPLVSAPEVRRILGHKSACTTWRWVNAELLPPPRKFRGRNYWLQSQIEAVHARITPGDESVGARLQQSRQAAGAR